MIPPRATDIAMLLAAVVLVGCQPAGDPLGATPPAPVGPGAVAVVNLRASPSAMNWDNQPGLDGVVVRVDCFKRGPNNELPVMVPGALEFTLYEGVIAREKLIQASPLRKWRFSGKQLEPFRARSMVGWGYSIPLGWGDRRPGTSAVTLAARYIALSGATIEADPAVIAVGRH